MTETLSIKLVKLLKNQNLMKIDGTNVGKEYISLSTDKKRLSISFKILVNGGLLVMKHIPMKPISKMSQRTFRKFWMSFGFADRNEVNYCVEFIKSRKGTISYRLFIEVAFYYLNNLYLRQICDWFDWLAGDDYEHWLKDE